MAGLELEGLEERFGGPVEVLEAVEGLAEVVPVDGAADRTARP